MDPQRNRLECPQAWKLIDRMCGGGLPGPVAVELRKHLAACPDCKARYREQIETTAALGASLRGRAHVPSRGPSWTGGSRRDRRLRGSLLFVMASFLIAMVAKLDGDWEFDPSLRLVWTEGSLWAGGELVNEQNPVVDLQRSDLVVAEPTARGRILGRSLELELEPGARLLVVSAVAQRLRLELGRVTVAGSGRLETPRGVVELEGGRARVVCTDRQLDVEALEGEVRRIDARGERRLELADAEH